MVVEDSLKEFGRQIKRICQKVKLKPQGYQHSNYLLNHSYFFKDWQKNAPPKFNFNILYTNGLSNNVAVSNWRIAPGKKEKVLNL